ncbi:MAG: hypothetical protein GY928_16410 [Colwellia sp.]|nr:hypothetical protein [Colwellia sp.]
MSDLNTLQALRQLLKTATITGVTNDDISYIDAPVIFNPAGKALWLSEGFIPASSESTGKTKASSDEDRGVYQITVYTPLLGGDFGVSLSTAIDEIKSVFFNGAASVYNTQKVDILEVVAQGVSNNDAWKRRVISINYLTFSTR